jgi:hypothetical protein
LKKHGQLYEDKGTPYENLGTLCSNLGMLSMFEGMPYEGEKGIREESRGHRAVLRMLATLRAHLGTPSMRFGMPNEKRTMPTVKPRIPRRHPPSLSIDWARARAQSRPCSRRAPSFPVSGSDEPWLISGSGLRSGQRRQTPSRLRPPRLATIVASCTICTGFAKCI